MDTKTYRSVEGFGKTGQIVRDFGERQNALNAEMHKRIRTLEAKNKALSGQLEEALSRIALLEAALERIAALEQEQAMNIKRFGRCAADLDALERETDRLKLTAKLNSNAIDRLSKK